MAFKQLIDKKINEFKLIDTIYTHNNYVNKQNCDYLINFYEKYANFALPESSTKFVDGKTYNHQDTFKCVNISELYKSNKEHDEINIAYNFTMQLIGALCINYVSYMKSNFDKNFPSNMYRYTDNIRILKYGEHSNIEDHLDISDRNENNLIQVRGSCTINLNDDYEGGDFRFFGSRYKIKLKQGDGLFFPAEPTMIHGTDSVIKGTRYSLNCFVGIP
jgi:hypothetical protein